MKRTTLLTAVLTFAVLISMVITVQAEPVMGGKHWSGPGLAGNGVMRTLMQLDLSQDQKKDIYSILQKYRDEQQAIRTSIEGHKKEFSDMTAGSQFDEDKVRQAFQESVPAIEEAFVLRARIKSEINAVLTLEQLGELRQIRAENVKRRQGKKNHEFRRATLETWLTMDSE